ncbi:MAG: hypothetical protein ACRD0U_06760, partial [Acidimicrobiales bacterium]
MALAPDAHLAQVRKAERLVEDVERTRDQLRDDARELLGVSGDHAAAVAPLRQTLAEHGLTLYPLAALGSLAVVDTFYGYAFSVLAPEISRSLGIGLGAIAGAVAVKGLAGAIAPLALAALAERPRRAFLALITGVVWSICTILTGYVTLIWGLLVLLFIDGLSTGSVASLHQPLLMDSHPPPARVRALT